MSDRQNYIAVTSSYWGFTVTDGALRMLVLLHFHTLGFSPIDLASLFILYELMGVFTNFFGGWIGSRYGLRVTLYAGLLIQIVALIMLSNIRADWLISASAVYVMLTQALSGVAKDLTKMSSKSTVKVVVGSGNQGLLFKWVAILTGSKNAFKGVGFFVGGLFLEVMGFKYSLWLMALLLGIILCISIFFVQSKLGKAKDKIKKRELFSKTREINYLSVARLFLFASRDVWFVVALPVFLYSNLAWSFNQVGAFMAFWVLGYGVVQALVPRFFKNTVDAVRVANSIKFWGLLLAGIPIFMAIGFVWEYEWTDISQGLWIKLIILGVLIFGIVFAVNSSIHSFLILAYSDQEKVALNIGFYYMANALGRLLGTIFSGITYQFYGLSGCLFVSGILVFLAVLLSWPLNRKSFFRPIV